jgi:hypothetical protein
VTLHASCTSSRFPFQVTPHTSPLCLHHSCASLGFPFQATRLFISVTRGFVTSPWLLPHHYRDPALFPPPHLCPFQLRWVCDRVIVGDRRLPPLPIVWGSTSIAFHNYDHLGDGKPYPLKPQTARKASQQAGLPRF